MDLKDISLENLPLDEIPELKALTNDRQRNFAVFYVSNGGNGADAARRAGYSDKTANRTGGQIAKTPSMKAAVRATREWYFANLIMGKNEALAVLSQFARGNLADVLDDDGLIDGRAVKRAGRIVESYDVKETFTEDGSSIQKKVKLRDPRAAIETIGKALGWFKEEVTIKTEHVQITMDAI